MNGEEFLDKLYRDLHLSDEVMHKSLKSDNKYEKISKYMERLDKSNKLANNEHKRKLLKSLYHKKYVIKEKNIPDDKDKKKIIKAQEESLDNWLDYLLSLDKYPVWTKYWAFQGMLRIGTYDVANGVYMKRSKKTIAPFIEANPVIISRCIEAIQNYVNNKKLSDEEVLQLVDTGNFSKIYTLLVNENKNQNNSLGNDGIWIMYQMESIKDVERKEQDGSIPEYLKLYNSLQGYNTGWCTAEDVTTAKDQICGTTSYDGGDFYVYYTKDKNNEYKIPRIAIRMDGHDKIGEIRGVLENENVEDVLEIIIKDKLNSMKLFNEEEIQKYLRIIYNLKRITYLSKKNISKEDFTYEDIIFLYQIYNKIEVFNWKEANKVKSIINSRDIGKDYNRLDNYQEKVNFLVSLASYRLEKNISNIDFNIILDAIEGDAFCINYVDKKLLSNKEFIMICIRKNWKVLKYVDEGLKNDKEVILEATNYGMYLDKYIGAYLLNDKEFMINIRNIIQLNINKLKSNRRISRRV